MKENLYIILFFCFLLTNCTQRDLSVTKEENRYIKWESVKLIKNDRNYSVEQETIITRNGSYGLYECDKSGKRLMVIKESRISPDNLSEINKLLNDYFFKLKEEYAVYATDKESNTIIVCDSSGKIVYTVVYYKEAFSNNEDVKNFYKIWDYIYSL